MSHNLEMAPDEKLLVMVRKHWFVFTQSAIGTVLVALLPLVSSVVFVATTGLTAAVPILVYISFLWMALCMMALANLWTNFYLDLWVVTDKRIIYIEQRRLFSREITTLRIERIQDATVTYHHFLETMLDYGTLRIQSAGAVADDLEVHGIPHPERVKQVVLSEVDRQHKEHMEKGIPLANEHAAMTGTWGV